MRLLRLSILSPLLIALAAGPAHANAARQTYERALARERALAAKAAPELGEVRQVSSSFELVARRHPSSGYADNALLKAAELAEQAFARSGTDADRRRARQLYSWLAREYPTSPFVKRASAAARALDAEIPADTVASGKKPIAAPENAAADAVPRPADDAAATAAPTAVTASTPASTPATAARQVLVREVRRAVLPELVRVTIELDEEVGYHQERLEGPPRVFFDLKGTVAAPALQNAVLTWPDDVVRQVRFGRPAANTTRVVLDLDGASRYSVFTLYNPYRLVVDVERASGKRAGLQPSLPQPVVEREATAGEAAWLPPAKGPAVLPPAPPPVHQVSKLLTPDLDLDPEPAPPKVDPRDIDGRDVSIETEPTVASRSIEPAPSPKQLPETRSPKPPAATGQPATDTVPAPRAPAANSNGSFSLARQLGLGVSRIVIDPGHGGHDPGAKVKGLSEAALVLDVSLRLEKLLLKQPGVEVVLTRRTDTFVELEERTAIANREKADLFLSIHANASRNAKAQGVETYFLNFATTPEAELVAARENSASGRAMHHLPDIVRAIALNNKVDESRDLARMVQDAMVKRLGGQHKQLRNLGVKQAPFVVLIGAAMPSVLAEISFLTNPREAQLLRSDAYRQKVAEALFDAVMRYQRSLKSVGTVAAQ